MEPLVIQINWVYFLGIIGFLIVLAWRAGGRFASIETSITCIKESITRLEVLLSQNGFSPEDLDKPE